MTSRCAIAFAVVALLTAVLVARALSRDDSLGRIRRAGEIRIGYAVEPPFAFADGRGEISGEAPETARVVVERLGLGRVVWRQVAFDLLLDELRAGRIDVIAAGMFITPERAQLIRFSQPTVRVRPGLLVRRGNPHGLHSYADLAASPATRVAVLSGSVEEWLADQAGVPRERLVPVPDASTGRAAVESGAADALALSGPTLRWMLRQDRRKRTELADPFDEPRIDGVPMSGLAAFGFRHEDRALADAWDAELTRLVGTPMHRDLIARFGFLYPANAHADAPVNPPSEP